MTRRPAVALALTAALCLGGTVGAAAAPAPGRAPGRTAVTPAAAAAPAGQVLSVDLAHDTGAVHGGATGALYGLGQDGVPSEDSLAPLHIKAIAQKPTDGLQHPSGDFSHIAPEFFRTGGRQVFVYVQDTLAKFPYEDNGIPDYLTKLAPIVADVVASPYRAGAVYVPFNEPDNIWYDLHSDRPAYATDLPRFEADWATVYRFIRARDPGAKIAGPNTSSYDATFVADFLAYAKAHDVVSDVVTWHELDTSFFSQWYSHIDGYRATEKRLGLPAIPVDINEYGLRRDLSQPGQMIQWMTRFENSKVDAMQAYWDITENLQDNVVGTGSANGDWWLLEWYGSLAGHTVAVTPPTPDGLDTLQGIATLDTTNRRAQVLLGGTTGPVTVRVGSVPAALGSRVHATVERTSWTGYEGTAPTPPVVSEADLPVVGGVVRVPVTTDAQSAYRVTLTPAVRRGPVAAAVPTTRRYEAEAATVTDGAVSAGGVPSNPNTYHASGDARVTGLDKPDSRVGFAVTVPTTGTYRMDVLYGNGTGTQASQVLRVDSGDPTLLTYPPTLNSSFAGRRSVEVPLTAGRHTISLAVSDPDIGSGRGSVTLDAIDLTPVDPAAATAGTTYQAEDAQLGGTARVLSSRSGYTGTGYVSGSGAARTDFVVTATRPGFARVDLRYATAPGDAPAVTRSLDGVALAPVRLPASSAAQPFRTASQVVYLTDGINRLSIGTTGSAVAVDSLAVTPVSGAAGLAITTTEAEGPGVTRTGTATVEANPYASGGAVVTGAGKGTGALTLTAVEAATAGDYAVTFYYADAERNSPDHYNTDLIDEFADVSVNGAAGQRTYFRNTLSADQFVPRTVHVRLAAGTNTIRIANPSAQAPDIDRVVVARLSSN